MYVDVGFTGDGSSMSDVKFNELFNQIGFEESLVLAAGASVTLVVPFCPHPRKAAPVDIDMASADASRTLGR